MRSLIRILVVDDSLVCRELLTKLINQQPDIQVVGEAGRGKQAIELNRKLRPDLITMDIQMPGMDGFSTIEEIMATAPVPILVVTSAPVRHGVDQTFRAISAGALDLVKKPELNDKDARILIERIRLLAGVSVVGHRIRHRRKRQPAIRPSQAATTRPRTRLIAIASSTGGPKVLLELLRSLPRKLGSAILLTQHLPEGFSAGFTNWLNSEVPQTVSEARDGDVMRPGRVLVAPSDRHLTVQSTEMVALSDAPPVHSHRPSADPMFCSVAEKMGERAMGVVLTGMGRDGAEGLLRLRKAGGICLAQDEASSLIFGMPKAAIDLGAVDQVLDVTGIASTILSSAGEVA